MGPEQVKAAGMYAHGTAGTLSFESLPYQAQCTTYSANNSVTDSAAAATAIATGNKVDNGDISLYDGSELETLLEYFKTREKSTGLVTTQYISQATATVYRKVHSIRETARILGLSPSAILDLIWGCGAVPVLAHPGLCRWDDLELYFREWDLGGIEVEHPGHNAEMVERLRCWAGARDLPATGL